MPSPHIWTLRRENLMKGVPSMMAENPEVESETEWRNWAELPADLLSIIFIKLGAVVILQSAEAVCLSWRQLALDPKFYLRIHISCTPEDAIPMEKLARKAIDRSAGQAESFFAKYCGSDDLLTYIADRTTGMKRLTLIFPRRITRKGMVKLVRRCPLLEKCAVLGSIRELERKLSEGVCIRRACTRMEFFGLAKVYHGPNGCWESGIDLQALETEDSVPQLHEPRESTCNLAIFKGLRAIIGKYLHAQDLVVQQYYVPPFTVNVDTDASLHANVVKYYSTSFACPKNDDGEYRRSYSRILLGFKWDLKKLS